jgi:hypothetical protein
MAEPVVSPAASAAAAGLSSGLIGALLVPLGLTWPLLLWAGLGCIVGLSWAPAVGRLRASALFGASAMLSAKGGAVASALWWAASVDAAQGSAAVLGIVFHPLLTALVGALPAIISKRLA